MELEVIESRDPYWVCPGTYIITCIERDCQSFSIEANTLAEAINKFIILHDNEHVNKKTGEVWCGGNYCSIILPGNKFIERWRV